MGGFSGENNKQVSSYYNTHRDVYSTSSQSVEKVYKSRSVVDSLIPKKSKLPREACDSPGCPDSRAVAVFYDTTASMNNFLMDLVKTQMPKIAVDLPKSVSYDPQILFGGVNDIRGFSASDYPLQIGQFEATFNQMIDQLTSIYVEGGGSGNGSESYILAHYFAARYTRLESLEKRGKKGFLFVVGDDGPTPDVTQSEIRQTFGKDDPDFSGTLTADDVLTLAEEKFNVYQIIVHGDAYESDVVRKWRNLVGGHAIDLNDYKCISELIITIMRMYDGMTKTEALDKLESYTRSVIERALENHEEVVHETSQPVDNSEIEEF